MPDSPIVEIPPSPWITRYGSLAVPGSPVLDVACGAGRHARWFAARGHPVVAVDRDPAALASVAGLAGIAAFELDLEAGPWPYAGRSFGAVVVSRYLHRPLFPHLAAAVGDDGLLVYETFAVGNEAVGRPSNPDFLLREGELLAAFGGRLTIVAFEQGLEREGDSVRVVQRIAALGPGRPWPPELPARAAPAPGGAGAVRRGRIG